MNVRLKPLQEQVLVITGATSGIGLCTARMAAREGVRGLVLVARSRDALHGLEREINATGRTHAVAVPCDVANKACLRQVAEVARERFGGFDTWINNAGISIYGHLREVGDADHRRLFETNFWGLVNGSLIAVEHLKNRGGAIINIGSTLSERSIPIQGMYSATKHAVKAFTDALRMECEEAALPVSFTLIKPAAIDTPYTAHAKNYLEDAPSNPPPVYAPDIVAHAILYAAGHPVRDLFAGGAGKAFQLAEKFAPRTTDHLMERITMKQMHSGKPRYDRDALYAAGNDQEVRERGDYDGKVRETSLYTTAMTHPRLSLTTVLGLGALSGAAIWYLRNSGMGRERMKVSMGREVGPPTGSLKDQAKTDTYAL